MPSQVCKLKRMKVAFPICHFPHVAASIMQVYRKAGFFFNACMRIKVKPLVSAMQWALPSSCSRRAYPQPRDALIETCCQSDKHICIQSTLYLFSLERSTVCCWLNILNQFAVSKLPASSLVSAPSSLGDRLAGMGVGGTEITIPPSFFLTLSSFAPWWLVLQSFFRTFFDGHRSAVPSAQPEF